MGKVNGLKGEKGERFETLINGIPCEVIKQDGSYTIVRDLKTGHDYMIGNKALMRLQIKGGEQNAGSGFLPEVQD